MTPPSLPRKPELLSPAGSFGALVAAVNNGADAVYFGGQSFNARTAAANFTDTELADAFGYCRLRGVKAYAAVNTLLKDGELPAVLRFVEFCAQNGADAFIIQDMGLARALRQSAPDLPLHASTQTTAKTLEDVLFLKESGFSRVILARELSLSQVEDITKNSAIETEVFAHGALCVCCSGQCLFSSLLGEAGERSGNRGSCAQPCRLKYSLNGVDGYLLSPRDLSAIEILPELIKTGVAALKIEGRMRSPQYVAIATSLYRKALDGEEVSADELRALAQAFTRGGFSTPACLTAHAGRGLMSVESPKNSGLLCGRVASVLPDGSCRVKAETAFVPGDGVEIWTSAEPHPGAGIDRPVPPGRSVTLKLNAGALAQKGDRVFKTCDKTVNDFCAKLARAETRKLPVRASFAANIGEPAKLTLEYGGIIIEEFSAPLAMADNAPTTPESMRKSLSKTGDSTFAFVWDDFTCAEGMFFHVSSMNALRRGAVERLAQAILGDGRKNVNISLPPAEPRPQPAPEPSLTVHACTLEQTESILSANMRIDRFIFELPDTRTRGEAVEELQTAAALCRKANVPFFIALPIMATGREADYADLPNLGADGFLARTWGQLRALRNCGAQIAADYSIPVWNAQAAAFLGQYAQTVTISPEHEPDLTLFPNIATEKIVYGHVRLMATRHCSVGSYIGKRGKDGFRCDRAWEKKAYSLTDRRGASYPISRDCGTCGALILSAKPVNERLEADAAGRYDSVRLVFTVETGEDARKITERRVRDMRKHDVQ